MCVCATWLRFAVSGKSVVKFKKIFLAKLKRRRLQGELGVVTRADGAACQGEKLFGTSETRRGKIINKAPTRLLHYFWMMFSLGQDGGAFQGMGKFVCVKFGALVLPESDKS